MTIKELWEKRIQWLVVLCLLVTFYWMTRPLNHAESYDSINYVLFAENFPLGTAPDSRNILFHAFNRILVVTSDTLGLNIGSLELLSSVSILTGALSLMLFAGLMKKRFGVSTFSAWAGAAFLGSTYGYWRYTGAVEVYIPSMFLILCSLSLIFNFLEDENRSQRTLVAAAVLSGLAVLYYQPNIIVLFGATFTLFCSSSRWLWFVRYSTIGALVVLLGVALTFMTIHGNFPTSINELVGFINARNGEFRGRQSVGISVIKAVLAFGHDVLSAHWTRVIAPVRDFLDPLVPGCVYNFNVVIFGGKGIQQFVAVAAVLFIPILVLFARINWIASSKWKIASPNRRTLFLLGWIVVLSLIVGVIDPGGFEPWIPLLLPFAGLLTILVIEPCYQLGKTKALLAFLTLLFCYNFFGGAIIWRNNQGDDFYHKTAWIRSEVKEDDVVLLNQYDYRIVDYLNYYSKARIVHLSGDDMVSLERCDPNIKYILLDEFISQCEAEKTRVFTLGEVLSPTPDIKQCRLGEDKFNAARKLADLLKKNAVRVDESDSGDTYQIKFGQ